MKLAVCDASVAVKWFARAGEDELSAADRIRAAWGDREIEVAMTELVFLEVGNGLLRGRGWPPAAVVRHLNDLAALKPARFEISAELLTAAAYFGAEYGLTLYDAAHFSLAQILDAPLITADRALLAAGGVSPTDYAASLH